MMIRQSGGVVARLYGFIGSMLVMLALLTTGAYVLGARAGDKESDTSITAEKVYEELRQVESVFVSITKPPNGKRMDFQVRDASVLERLLNSIRSGTVIGVHDIRPREHSLVTDTLVFQFSSTGIAQVDYVSSTNMLIIPYFFYAKDEGPVFLTPSISQRELTVFKMRARQILLRPGPDLLPVLRAMESDQWRLH